MPDYGITLAILSVCILINYNIGPVTSDSRPTLSAEALKRGKLHIVIATLYATILTALFYETPLAPIGFWTIVLHSVQLIIANLRKKRGKKYV